MIAESMSVNISTSTEGGDSVTVSATDEDAGRLKELLRNAGIGGDSHSDSGCGCGTTPCSCAEVVDENQPDWPTDEVTSDDVLQYSGGLNKPKTDVAGSGQTTVPVTAVRVQEGEQELDESKCNECGMYESKCECDTEVDESLERMQSLAGIQEAKPDFLDLDRDGNKKEPMKKAADDKKAVKESGTGDAPISKMSDQDLADYCDMSVEEVKRDRARAEEVARDKTDDLKEGEAFQSSLLDMTRLWKQYKA
jgi:hypothetical protein